MDKPRIAVGSDHAGYTMKAVLVDALRREGYPIEDFGTNGPQSVDYPDFVHPVAERVETEMSRFGLLLCGSGNGVCMTANKHAGIRAGLCWTEELAGLARAHNDANVLCIPARFVDDVTALAMVRVFLETAFEGGRHARRVQKIPCRLNTETVAGKPLRSQSESKAKPQPHSQTGAQTESQIGGQPD